jgi:PST family polysaccharide transporter
MVMVTGLFLVGLSVLFGGWWADLNKLPELSRIICVLSLCIPIEALTTVQKSILQREMDFRSLSLRGNLSAVAGGAVGVGMALGGFGVWALIGQQLTKDIAALLLLWTLSPWRPHWRFSGSHLKELLGFSTANFIAKMGVFAHGQMDALLMGLFFGPVAVGLYRLADRLMNMILTMATQSLQTVSFSQFSKLQDKPQELQQSVLYCIRASSMLTIPAMAGLFVTSDLVVVAIGPQWTSAGDALKLLCILGILASFGRFTGPLLQALSRPHYLAILEWAVTGLSLGALIFVAFLLKTATVHAQITGIAAARLITSGFLFTPIFFLVLARFSNVSLNRFAVSIRPALLAAAATAATATLLLQGMSLDVNEPRLALAIVVTVGGLVALGTLLLLDPELRRIIIAGFSEIRGQIRRHVA